jgi:hypothetical protein
LWFLRATPLLNTFRASGELLSLLSLYQGVMQKIRGALPVRIFEQTIFGFGLPKKFQELFEWRFPAPREPK